MGIYDPPDTGLAEHLGLSRVLDERRRLPQAAERLDGTGPARPGEVAIAIEYLNIDSASWSDLRTHTGDDGSAIATELLTWSRTYGKIKNPRTGSGGMLVGTVTTLGDGRQQPAIGTRVATLVSLSATPLELDKIAVSHSNKPLVRAGGTAYLPPSAPLAEVPDDLPLTTSLQILDVCGAPAWVQRYATEGQSVVVLGAGGKSGVLCVAQALQNVGSAGRVVAVCWPPETADIFRETDAEVVAVDCTDAIAVADAVQNVIGGGADLVVVCANVSGCEGAAVLAAAREGTVVFFSMATSFATATLGAESVGKPVTMVMGNGYLDGHAELAISVYRTNTWLQSLFGEPNAH